MNSSHPNQITHIPTSQKSNGQLLISAKQTESVFTKGCSQVGPNLFIHALVKFLNRVFGQERFN